MDLASKPLPGTPIPELITDWAQRHSCEVVELVWQNELGGVTARLTRRQGADLFIKHSTHDLLPEAERTSWLSSRFAAPLMADFEEHDDQWLLVTVDLGGASAVSDRWKGEPDVAAAAIGEGLGRLHSLDPADSLFGPPEWVEDEEDIDDLVIVHGDACAPNTILADDGNFLGIVDLGALGVADKWADLAIASWSLEWNFGPGHEKEFWAAYGEAPDPDRIQRYRELWERS